MADLALAPREQEQELEQALEAGVKQQGKEAGSKGSKEGKRGKGGKGGGSSSGATSKEGVGRAKAAA